MDDINSLTWSGLFESSRTTQERLQIQLSDERIRDALRESGWLVGEWHMCLVGPVYGRRIEK